MPEFFNIRPRVLQYKANILKKNLPMIALVNANFERIVLGISFSVRFRFIATIHGFNGRNQRPKPTKTESGRPATLLETPY